MRTSKNARRPRVPREEEGAVFDLANPEHLSLVRSLYFGRLLPWVIAEGLDVEETLQHLLEGLLRKSRSPRSCWNPERGALCTWAFVAMSGLLSNRIVSAQRKARGHLVLVDAALAASGDAVEDIDEIEIPALPTSTRLHHAARVGVGVVKIRRAVSPA